MAVNEGGMILEIVGVGREGVYIQHVHKTMQFQAEANVYHDSNKQQFIKYDLLADDI